VSFENRYSAMDRLLHRVAFASAPMQLAIADLEDRLFASQLESVEIRRPVFVTALPRAGTTLVLDILESQNEFVSHSYRHMPFVLCPMLWSKFAKRFQRPGELQERAHQDGMLVSEDSPEAFEEMLWKAFWRRNYGADRIHPWRENDPEFFEFMRSHMRKIIAGGRSSHDSQLRYLSKNNLNIARIALLRKHFPDAVIVVPFREPLQHAASLLRQHLNFLEIHRDDRFARQYMAGIGHYDFGANLRPVNFDGWLDSSQFPDPTTLGFWLEYWLATYQNLGKCDDVLLLCYEQLCESPESSLQRLANALSLEDRNGLLDQSSRFRSPQPHPVELEPAWLTVADRAKDLYRALRKS